MKQKQLVVNGDPRRFDAAENLADVLEALALDPRGVVVEHNRTIVRRPALGTTPVEDGDAIEIVHFVGGG